MVHGDRMIEVSSAFTLAMERGDAHHALFNVGLTPGNPRNGISFAKASSRQH
jgi:hypothetical protein